MTNNNNKDYALDQLKQMNENQSKIITAQRYEIERLYKELHKTSDKRLIDANRTILQLICYSLAEIMEKEVEHAIIINGSKS